MKSELKIYKDRGCFANAMLDKYFTMAPNKIVSDIGAGFGFMKIKIEDLGGTWQPFDYINKIPETTIWDLNMPNPKKSKRPGTVIFLEVLEHLPNPLLALENIAGHMEEEGYLILTTPNPRSSKNIINLVLKGTLYAFQEKHLGEHHVFTPWEHIVKHFLNSQGLEIIEYGIVDIQYQKRKKYGFKEYVKFLIEKILEWRNPKSIGMSYGMVAKKSKKYF